MIEYMDFLLEGVVLRLGSLSHSDCIFYLKENDVLMYFEPEGNYLLISYDKIWQEIDKRFSLKYEAIQELIRRYMLLRYNLEVNYIGFRIDYIHWV